MFQDKPDAFYFFQPENDFEARLLESPEFQEGLNWGKPRFGHPEGKVGYHVRDVLENVERQAKNLEDKQKLRLIAIAHDAFKYKEFVLGRRIKHHGMLAREFMEAHINDPVLLDIIELHDEAFYCWRNAYLEQNQLVAQQRLEKLLERMGENLPLYFDFYKCDTQTGDKVQAPLYWFEEIVASF
ncbi:MAG: HD domain-containing protein [Saprospiraceae bacterium]|nr:HD domain-containing protein [Saprospiraceae bacterium]